MLKRIIFLICFLNASLYTFSQDQILYLNGYDEYVDSIVESKDDTLTYYNYKKTYKVSYNEIEGYFLTVRTKENLNKRYYRRDREYIRVSELGIDYEEKMNDTCINRDYILKTTTPNLSKGIYSILLGVEKPFGKRSSLNISVNASVIDNYKFSYNISSILNSELVDNYSYSSDGISLLLTAGYRYYILPFRNFRPGGIYFGGMLQAMYDNLNYEKKYFLDEELEYHYEIDILDYGVNIGLITGVQWLISGRISLGLELNTFSSISNFSYEQITYLNNGYDFDKLSKKNIQFDVQITLGYAFNK